MILGIASYSSAVYIEDQVSSGKAKLKNAQKKIDQTDQMLSLSPYSAPLGRGLKEATKEKLDEGKKQIIYYTDMANHLKVIGYVLMGTGLISLLFTFRKKKK